MKTMIYPVHREGHLTSEEQDLLNAVGTGMSSADLTRSLSSLSRSALYQRLNQLEEKGFIKTESVYATASV